MSSIQLKDVPEGSMRRLASVRPPAGMSLREYLLAHLVEEASTPTLDEVLGVAGSFGRT